MLQTLASPWAGPRGAEGGRPGASPHREPGCLLPGPQRTHLRSPAPGASGEAARGLRPLGRKTRLCAAPTRGTCRNAGTCSAPCRERGVRAPFSGSGQRTVSVLPFPNRRGESLPPSQTRRRGTLARGWGAGGAGHEDSELQGFRARLRRLESWTRPPTRLAGGRTRGKLRCEQFCVRDNGRGALAELPTPAPC